MFCWAIKNIRVVVWVRPTLNANEIQTAAMNFREGKSLKRHIYCSWDCFLYSFTLRSYYNEISHPGTVTVSHHSHQISPERVAEAGGVGPCPVPALWIALLSWHPSTVLKIHFGSWVCFSVNQLPIHCINLSRVFFKIFQSSKARLYRQFPDLLSQLSWQDPKLWTWNGRKPAHKGEMGGEEGKTEMWVQKKELNSKNWS